MKELEKSSFSYVVDLNSNLILGYNNIKMFEFKEDLKIIMNTLNISAYDLKDELGFDVPTISNWLNGKYEPDRRSKEDIYEFAYKRGLRINDAYSISLKNSSKKEGFKLLYHGAKCSIIEEIDLNHSRNNNDLGKGFYLGETIEQSSMFVADYPHSKIYGYGLYLKGLKVLELIDDLDWVLIIAKNRGRLDDFKDSKILKNLQNKVDKSDVVIAPIVDNRMFDIIDEFVNGMITDKACIYALAALHLGKQYCLKTNKAIKNLGFIKEFYTCASEKEDYLSRRNKLNQKRLEEIKNFRKLNKTGNYIEEILCEK